MAGTMRQWFARIFGGSSPSTGVSRPDVSAPAGPLASQSRTPGTLLSATQAEFLAGLAYPPDPVAIGECERSDRLFLGGLVKRLHARKFELLVLPDVAIRLSEMARKADQPVVEYVSLLNSDPALSVEVLKVANSAFYGSSVTTSSLHEAVVRIGLNRLQSILMLAHLNARVLSRRAIQEKAALLLELGFPLGFLAAHAAKVRGEASDACFTRGMLMHVEHLAIVGALGDIERERRCVINPSTRAMLQAFAVYGPDVRAALAKTWRLPDLLLCREEDLSARNEYVALRDALVCRWLGRPLPPLPELAPELVNELMEDILPRVAPGGDEPAPSGAAAASVH
jgi:HD-like signal output (HDOD) protein